MMWDAIIVGAGVSGLMSGVLLKSQGFKVLVLEARDRVGGRTCTIKDSNKSIDLGGQWVGNCQSRVMNLVKKLGLTHFEQYDKGKHIMNWGGKITEYDGNISQSFNSTQSEFDTNMKKFIQTMDLMAKELNGYKNLDGISAREWMETNCHDPQVREIIDWLFKVCICVESSNLSFYYWLYVINQSGGYSKIADIKGGAQEFRIRGGSMQISEQLVTQHNLNVKLNSPVIGIEQTKSYCVVRTREDEFKCKYVVVTIPPQLNRSIEYIPNLPNTKEILYQSIQMGQVIKIVITYSSPWWRAKGFSGEIISNQEPIFLAYDASVPEPNGYYGIVCFVCADNLKSYSKEKILDGLVRYFGDNRMGEPTGYYDKNWTEEEYSQGCYFGVTNKNILSQFRYEFTKSFGSIYWAGTETANEWMGYIEGAVESAERVVNQIVTIKSRL